jgi:RNA polymerase sigma-70 factor (ECF subfamily)
MRGTTLSASEIPEFQKALIADLTATVSSADAATLRRMLPSVYEELRHVAAAFLRSERPDHTLQPTALVHEAYLRMVDQRDAKWQNSAHLLGIFARMMRRILVDHASARVAAKRGGKDAVHVMLDDALDVYDRHELNLLELEEALRGLNALDPQQARIVEMRFFGGMTVEEIAKVLDVSPRTVKRDWVVAKRWLRRALSAPA